MATKDKGVDRGVGRQGEGENADAEKEAPTPREDATPEQEKPNLGNPTDAEASAPVAHPTLAEPDDDRVKAIRAQAQKDADRLEKDQASIREAAEKAAADNYMPPASSPSEAANGADRSGENAPHSPLTTN